MAWPAEPGAAYLQSLISSVCAEEIVLGAQKVFGRKFGASAGGTPSRNHLGCGCAPGTLVRLPSLTGCHTFLSNLPHTHKKPFYRRLICSAANWCLSHACGGAATAGPSSPNSTPKVEDGRASALRSSRRVTDGEVIPELWLAVRLALRDLVSNCGGGGAGGDGVLTDRLS